MISMLKPQGLGKDRRQAKDSVGSRKQLKEWFFKSTDCLIEVTRNSYLTGLASASFCLPLT